MTKKERFTVTIVQSAKASTLNPEETTHHAHDVRFDDEGGLELTSLTGGHSTLFGEGLWDSVIIRKAESA